MREIFLVAVLSCCTLAAAQTLSPEVKEFVKVNAPIVALEHVRVIDGTGASAREDQTIILANGKIESISNSPTAGTPPVKRPEGTQALDLHGYSVIPGLVGMHDHMFYPMGDGVFGEMAYSFPRLYLAGGVTTIRTTGSLEPYTDLELKKQIDAGQAPGPKIHVTGPYLEGPGSFAVQLHQLTGPEDATKTANYWMDEGVDNFKAYMFITPAELSAAIVAAHKRGVKVTGHLCSIGFREAAELGIDDLEHGLMVDTEFDPDKTPNVCPSQQLTAKTLAGIDIESAPVQSTIHDLVAHHVAVTSTIVIFETFSLNQPPLERRVIDAMLPELAVDYLTGRSLIAEKINSPWPVLLKKEMQFERDFVKSGGVLLA